MLTTYSKVEGEPGKEKITVVEPDDSYFKRNEPLNWGWGIQISLHSIVMN
jgi:hypothetical protein